MSRNSRIPLDGRAASFGPYRLCGATRRLRDDQGDVRLGSRALDLLIVLLERPGELVGKEELRERVWPDTFVSDDVLKRWLVVVKITAQLLDAGAKSGQRIRIRGDSL